MAQFSKDQEYWLGLPTALQQYLDRRYPNLRDMRGPMFPKTLYFLGTHTEDVQGPFDEAENEHMGLDCVHCLVLASGIVPQEDDAPVPETELFPTGFTTIA